MDEIKPLSPQPEAPASGRHPNVLKRLYREEGEAWRVHYRKYFKVAARALGLGFVAGFLYFWIWPGQEKKALEFVVRSLKDIPLGGSALVLSLTLFYHNVRASAVALAAGIVPYLFLPILDAALNGGVLGLLVSIARHQHLDVPRLVVTQILPHGIFELTAVLYATSLGLYLSAGMGKKVVAAWKRRSAAEAPGLFRNVVRSFILVVLPLLLVAAFIESFVTPHLR